MQRSFWVRDQPMKAVTSAFIGCTHTQNDPCGDVNIISLMKFCFSGHINQEGSSEE